MCVRARAHVRMCTSRTLTQSRVGVCVWVVDDSLYCKAAPCDLCCVHLSALGTGRWRSCIERTRAVIALRGTAAVVLGRCVLRPCLFILLRHSTLNVRCKNIHQTLVVKVDQHPLLLVGKTRVTAWPNDRAHCTLAHVLDLLVDS